MHYKKELISALRSGRYKQHSPVNVHKLRFSDETYCIEGVMIDLYMELLELPRRTWDWTPEGEFKTPDGVYDSSPAYVDEFFGINLVGAINLRQMEHTGNTFKQLADYLEQQN